MSVELASFRLTEGIVYPEQASITVPDSPWPNP